MKIEYRDEQCLTRRLRTGESGAMREFYTHYADYLTGICSRYVADDNDTKDVLQNTLIKIFTSISSFECRERGSLKAWAAKIAVNESLKHLKTTKKRNEFLLIGYQDVVEESEQNDPPIADIPPEEIHQMLSQLPVGCRTVFNLHVFEEKTHREIAHLLDIKVGTSTSQFSRAKFLLANMIQNYYNKKLISLSNRYDERRMEKTDAAEDGGLPEARP